MQKYIPSQIEPKWQNKWREDRLFSPDLSQANKPFYNLMMFPYPSAEGLHVGNMYPFTGSDIFGRYKRMQGFDTFEPIGLDGFGIHSENYALQIGEHPMDLSKVTEKRFYEQLAMIGDGYDWDRTVETYKPGYYKWTQWLFLQMYKKGLAYRKKANVNWCPKDKTVLADEQVEAGECERCGSKVELRELEQWFFKITDYAEKLLKNLETIDWSQKVKIAQKNWIGKKTGINIEYQVEGLDKKITCFTTRPDTNFGATFIVIGPEHPFAALLKDSKEIQDYIAKTKNKSEAERIAEGRKKTGVFTGFYAVNNLNGSRLPIWVSDFVLGNVGTGAVVGVPGHDIRDFEFAKEFNIPIIRVVVGKDGDSSAITRPEQVQEEEGRMVNSEFLDGMDIHEATEKIMDYLQEKGWGEKVTAYHLRDWLISRQRYWGPPIPIIYCDKCGTVPVPEKDLPVELPYITQFRPTGTGKSPLASAPEFYNVKCPQCGGAARRETDVSDTFLDSAWYFLRYPSTRSARSGQLPFDPEITRKWLPVDMYIGGAEHSVLHLLYSRFVTMVLNDLGLIDFEEPFKTFYAHGLIIKDGTKMSKSKGNVINPDKYIKEYGADTLRTYLMFMGPLSEGGDFRDAGMNGVYRFLQRVWGLQEKVSKGIKTFDTSSLRIMHKTIKKVTEDIEQLKFNTAIAALMEWLNHLSRKDEIAPEEYQTFLLLLAPFAPHITEELWSSAVSRQPSDSSIHKQSWPQSDNKYLEAEELSVAVQINGKVRDVLLIQKDIVNNKEVIEKMAFESQKIQKFLEGKSVKKVVFIPGKIISFVLNS